MLLKIPTYIKTVILTEIKEFIIEELEFDLIHNLPLNSNNVKIYYTDSKLLNIMVIINHLEDENENDDVSDNIKDVSDNIKDISDNITDVSDTTEHDKDSENLDTFEYYYDSDDEINESYSNDIQMYLSFRYLYHVPWNH